MEFESYADIIDAFERDDMGYETVTDYINGENIKIKEIEMVEKANGGLTTMGYANGGGIGSMMKPKKKRVNFRGGGMDMGNTSNQAQSAASSGRGSRSNNNNNNNGGGNNDYRGPSQLGVSTRAVNRITAPPVDRSAVGQFSQYGQNVMNQNLGKNNPTKSGIFSGGFNPLSMILGLINPFLGIAPRGIGSLKGGFKGLAGKMRGINPLTGEPNTQQQYEDARYDRQQVGRLDKLFAAKDKGYNTLTPFGLFNDKFKTTNFTEGQQSKIDQLMAQGYMPSTARNVDSGRGSGLRNTLASQSMPKVNITGLNNNDFDGVQNVDRSITSGQIDEFGDNRNINMDEFGYGGAYGTSDQGFVNNPMGTSDQGFVNDPYGTSDQGFQGIGETTAGLPGSNVFAGNYSQNAVSKQLYGEEYDVLDPFTQQKIDSLIEQVGTKSTGELASNNNYDDADFVNKYGYPLTAGLVNNISPVVTQEYSSIGSLPKGAGFIMDGDLGSLQSTVDFSDMINKDINPELNYTGNFLDGKVNIDGTYKDGSGNINAGYNNNGFRTGVNYDGDSLSGGLQFNKQYEGGNPLRALLNSIRGK